MNVWKPENKSIWKCRKHEQQLKIQTSVAMKCVCDWKKKKNIKEMLTLKFSVSWSLYNVVWIHKGIFSVSISFCSFEGERPTGYGQNHRCCNVFTLKCAWHLKHISSRFSIKYDAHTPITNWILVDRHKRFSSF